MRRCVPPVFFKPVLAWGFLLIFLFSAHAGFSQRDSLLQVLKRLPSDSSKVDTYNELAYSLWSADPLKGVDYGHQALKLSDSIGYQKGKAVSYKTIGVCYWSMGSYAAALDAFLSGLKIAESIGDEENVNRIEHNMALVHESMGNNDQALQYFRKNLAWYSRSGQYIEMPRVYVNIGTVFFQMHAYDSAIENYRKALTVTDQKEKVDEERFVYINLSEVYYKKNDFAASKLYLQKAVEIYERMDDKSGLVECYVMYGRLQRSSQQWNDARENFVKALKLAQEGRFTHFYSDLYKSLASIDSAKGNFRGAFNNYQKAVAWQDSLRDFRQKSEYERLLVQYRTDQKEKENEQLRQANIINNIKIEENRRVMLIEGIASVLIIGLLVFFYYKRAQYQKKIEEAELQQKLREEKERIALDLHDNIGSQLTSLSLGITKFARDHNLEAAHLNQNVSSTIRELRDTIWAINQEEISIDQLADKVNNLFWRLRQSTDKIEFVLSIHPEHLIINLKPLQAINIFRIIQEAVHNSYQHSAAHKIAVGISAEEATLIVKVADDGRGFNVNENGSADHYGLRSMRKRAREIGGELVIKTEPNLGTCVEVIVPLTREVSV